MADVSVIIPCHQRVGMLRQCLDSLRRDSSEAISKQIIVLFNGTDPALERELSADDLAGVTVVRTR